jgi:PPM family protein phosphatase
MSQGFNFCGLSDIGLNRLSNQDMWTANPEIGFFALADGMGGRRGGDVAAKEALQALNQSIKQLFKHTNHFQNPINLQEELHKAIETSNRWVYRMGCSNEPLQGMGSTLCCLLWTDNTVYYAHVGDSRIYRFRNEKLEQLTRDHSLLAKWLAKKKPTSPVPPKNIITRAIGTSQKANPEIASSPYIPGDLYFMCSDGLSDVLSREDLQKILRSSSSLEKASKKMIDTAKKMGSSDNITVLMISSADVYSML